MRWIEEQQWIISLGGSGTGGHWNRQEYLFRTRIDWDCVSTR